VMKDASLNSKLFVAKDVSLSAKLAVTDDATLSSKLIVMKDASLNSKLLVAGDVSLNANLFVSNNASFNGNVTFVPGSISLSALEDGDTGSVDLTNPIHITSTLTVTQDVSFNSKLVTVGDVSFNSNLYIGNTSHASSYVTTSDYRIKHDVTPLPHTTYSVDDLNPVLYNNQITKKPEIGLIAHEVQEQFPFLVTGEKDGEVNQTVNYIGLIGLLIHEIKQLKQEIRNANAK